MILGIDVSRYQGEIDWPSAFAAGVRFAIIRATIGDYYTDPMFEANWDGAVAAGVKPGAYHVVRPDISADAQLLFLRSVLDGNSPNLVVLDCEVTAGSNIDDHIYWMGRKTREHYGPLGAKVWFYSAKWWWDPNVGAKDWMAQDPFGWWFAAYGSNTGQQPWADPPTRVIPTGWPEWDAWQYTSRGSVSGIVGNVDLNLMKQASYVSVWPEEPAPPPEPPAGDLEDRLHALEDWAASYER